MAATRLPGTPRLLRALNDRAALELLLTRGPLTRAQLGEMTGLSKVTASQLVERLEQRGLVRRAPHPTDTRATLVYLTDAAEELQRQIFPIAKAHDDRLLEGLDRCEIERLLDALMNRAESALLDNDR